MPPWLSISAIKDGAIIIAIIVLGWWVYHQGENTVRVKQFAALAQQMKHQQKIQSRWQAQQSQAQSELNNEISSISVPSGGVVRPIHVELCNNAGRSSKVMLSGTPSKTAGSHSAARGADVRSERDIGAAVQAFERKYETALAQCRAVIREWPTK